MILRVCKPIIACEHFSISCLCGNHYISSTLLIINYLSSSEIIHIFAVVPGFVPLYCIAYSFIYMPLRFPAEGGAGFGAVELEEASLVRCIGFRMILPGCVIAPVFYEVISEVSSIDAVLVAGTNVVITRKALFPRLTHSDHKVGVEGFQYVLVGPRGIRVADDYGLVLDCCSDAVWNDAVVGKVSASDHVAGSGSGNGR